jgi:hypothetical protein
MKELTIVGNVGKVFETRQSTILTYNLGNSIIGKSRDRIIFSEEQLLQEVRICYFLWLYL